MIVLWNVTCVSHGSTAAEAENNGQSQWDIRRRHHIKLLASKVKQSHGVEQGFLILVLTSLLH